MCSMCRNDFRVITNEPNNSRVLLVAEAGKVERGGGGSPFLPALMLRAHILLKLLSLGINPHMGKLHMSNMCPMPRVHGSERGLVEWAQHGSMVYLLGDIEGNVKG